MEAILTTIVWSSLFVLANERRSAWMRSMPSRGVSFQHEAQGWPGRDRLADVDLRAGLVLLADAIQLGLH